MVVKINIKIEYILYITFLYYVTILKYKLIVEKLNCYQILQPILEASLFHGIRRSKLRSFIFQTVKSQRLNNFWGYDLMLPVTSSKNMYFVFHNLPIWFVLCRIHKRRSKGKITGIPLSLGSSGTICYQFCSRKEARCV